MATYPCGSEWGIWDLHVHTPSSLVQNYGGDRDEVWDEFVDDLEALPPQYNVLGINDYLFVDGYKTLRRYRNSGRLQNIETLIPVVELRLDKFGGSTSSLSKVNYHVLFSPTLDPEVIEDQFIKQLEIVATLKEGDEYRAGLTRKSLRSFGEQIIESVDSEERLREYESPEAEGFNNATFPLRDIKDRLKASCFKGNVLTAVGKTEWADLKWTKQSIADKKTIINSANIVFGAYSSVQQCRANRVGLMKADVHGRLFDCSDAHALSSSSEKDRIGNCFTWVKANPTFAGLRHAITAYEDRVFLGSEPDQLKQVRQEPTRYIEGVSIRRVDESELEESWFDTTLEFNTGLIAIIGNKGNGKSALTDVIALLGNSRTDKYSFLNEEKFRRPPMRKAEHFCGTIRWRSGDEFQRNLGDGVPGEEAELVEYIPQGRFEDICNEIIEEGESECEREINRVVFSYIAKSERLGHDNLRDLIQDLAEDPESKRERLREELAKCNERIVELERKVSDEFQEELKTELNEKRRELAALEESEPEEVEAPKEGSAIEDEIEEIRVDLAGKLGRQEKLESRLESAKEELARLKRVTDRIGRFEERYERFVGKMAGLLGDQSFSAGQLIGLRVDMGPVGRAQDELSDEISELERELSTDDEESLVSRIESLQDEIEGKKSTLDDRAKRYQEYRDELEEWKGRKEEIVGEVGDSGTLRNLEARIEKLEEWPRKLQGKRDDRLDIVRQIHEQMIRIREVYSDLHEPIHSAIEENSLIEERYSLKFEAVIRERQFADQFLSLINQGSRGTFYGVKEGRQIVEGHLEDTSFSQVDSVVEFCTKIEEALWYDQRTDPNEPREPEEQLVTHATKKELYNLVYGLGYLEPDYQLRMGAGAIEHLSPGERGIALLIFYLLVSKDDRPILIDQPEGNLDSQSVFEFLVPCIKEARRGRQIFLVTHSANLAVVCDAEQIIHAVIDKGAGNRVEYQSGALESARFNQLSVDVLEGTAPAFSDRRRKYFSVEM